jgi:hypothetical protein
MMKKKAILFTILVLFLLLLALWTTRFFSEKQLDDVTPGIPCDESLMERVDAFYVIPIFQGIKISENKSWCEYILSFNKSLRLHGFYHEYNEFEIERNESYMMEAIQIFEECFNQTPERFKAPQIETTGKNKRVIEKSLKIDGPSNQILHKVYHCNDSGIPYNWFNDLF